MTEVGSAGRAEAALSVRDLCVTVEIPGTSALLLDNVSLRANNGEIHGLVGESGCGKSTFVKSLLALLPNNCRVSGGEISVGSRRLELQSERQMRRIRGAVVALIPQDPYQALNPLFTIGDQLLPAIRRILNSRDPASRVTHREARDTLVFYITQCAVRDPEGALSRYPHEFSGGQLQRILISAALACKPALLLADEPTSALDVTTQREITRLIRQMAQRDQVAAVFVTHDLGLVSEICDRVSVMYCGQIVESGETRDVLNAPAHPYTQMLLACHPDRSANPVGIPGIVPQLNSLPSGCRFSNRCPSAGPLCGDKPESTDLSPRHRASCWALDAAGGPAHE